MKKLLLLINCILTFLLAAALWSTFFAAEPAEQVVAAKKNKKNNKNSAAQTAPAAAPSRFQYPEGATAAAAIVKKNIFDSQRIGGAVGGRGVVTYSLVGITKVGNVQTAVILSKGGARNRNAANNKQYYRVGDQLPNGYTLSQIDPDGVTLNRGGATMTLKMAMASENFPARSVRRSQPNQTQQMLNLMRMQMNMQQQQNRNMMQMMRNNQNSGGSSRGGSTNSRGRR